MRCERSCEKLAGAVCWTLCLKRTDFFLLAMYYCLLWNAFYNAIYNAICDHSELFYLPGQCVAPITASTIRRKLITRNLTGFRGRNPDFNRTTFLRFSATSKNLQSKIPRRLEKSLGSKGMPWRLHRNGAKNWSLLQKKRWEILTKNQAEEPSELHKTYGIVEFIWAYVSSLSLWESHNETTCLRQAFESMALISAWSLERGKTFLNISISQLDDVKLFQFSWTRTSGWEVRNCWSSASRPSYKMDQKILTSSHFASI